MITAFQLKITALITMVIDHVGVSLLYSNKLSASLYTVMRSLGRIAFPLYCFMLVNGYKMTGNREKYLTRILLLSVISQIPYELALNKLNYTRSVETLFSLRTDPLYIAAGLIAAAYLILRGKGKLSAAFLGAYIVAGLSLNVGGYVILSGRLNVFFTLACSLAVLCVLGDIKTFEKSTAAKAAVCSLVGFVILKTSDYGYMGLLLVLMLYFTAEIRWAQAISVPLWAILLYHNYSVSFALPLIFGTAAAAIPILLYNGEQGRKARLFYLTYPVHLMIIAIIKEAI